MVLIGQVTCRMEDVKEVAKIYSTFEKLPDYIRKAGPYFQINKEKGLHALSIYRVEEEGDLDKAHAYLQERLKAFKVIDTASFSVRRWQDLPEALVTLRAMAPSPEPDQPL